MNKKRCMAYAILVIAFALFNLIAFVIPSAKNTTFWIAYVFTAIAFVFQIGIWEFAFKGTDATLKSKFLSIPLIAIGLRYLLIQSIAFVIFMALPMAPSWIAIVVCAFILGGSAICLIATEISREEISRAEEKVEKKVFYIKSLQVDVEMLAEAERNCEIKEALTKLAEKLRFSDPMSGDALTDLETKIADRINELKVSENKANVIAELDLLLTERNKKAKITK